MQSHFNKSVEVFKKNRSSLTGRGFFSLNPGLRWNSSQGSHPNFPNHFSGKSRRFRRSQVWEKNQNNYSALQRSQQNHLQPQNSNYLLPTTINKISAAKTVFSAAKPGFSSLEFRCSTQASV